MIIVGTQKYTYNKKETSDFMKKFFTISAAVAAICITMFSGCEKKAGEIIDDISDTTVSESFSETEANISDASETIETTEETVESMPTDVSETEMTTITGRPASSQSVPENFPVGEWIESRSYIYNFDENGNVSIDTGFHTLNGTYEYSENDFIIKLVNGWGDTYTYDFTVRFEDSYTALEFEGCPEDKYMSFEPTGLLTGYSSAFGGPDEFRLMPYSGGLKNVTSPEEIQGLWQFYYSDTEPEDEIWIFSGDNIVLLGNNEWDKFPEMDENGYTIIDEDYGISVDYEDGKGEQMIYAQTLLRTYGDTLYMCYSTQDADIFKSYQPEPVPKDFLDGTISSYGCVDGFLDGYFIDMKNGKGSFGETIYDKDHTAELKLNGNKLTVTIDDETQTFDCYYLSDDEEKKLYIIDMEALKNNNEEFYSYFRKSEWLNQ